MGSLGGYGKFRKSMIIQIIEKKTKMSVPKKFAICVDLGATTVKAGIVTLNGTIPDQISAETKADKGPTTVIKQIPNFCMEEFLTG